MSHLKIIKNSITFIQAQSCYIAYSSSNAVPQDFLSKYLKRNLMRVLEYFSNAGGRRFLRNAGVC